MSEEIIKSEYLYRGKILNVRLDQVRLTDERKSRVVSREIIEHHGAVAIVALDAKENVLLVKQYRSAIRQEILEIPAGTLEVGEEPAKCAVRELQEETGYRAARWEELGKIFPSPGYATEQMWLYFARDLTLSHSALEEDESLQVLQIPFIQALTMIEGGEIIDSKTVAALLRVWKKLHG